MTSQTISNSKEIISLTKEYLENQITKDIFLFKLDEIKKRMKKPMMQVCGRCNTLLLEIEQEYCMDCVSELRDNNQEAILKHRENV